MLLLQEISQHVTEIEHIALITSTRRLNLIQIYCITGFIDLMGLWQQSRHMVYGKMSTLSHAWIPHVHSA